MLNMEPENGPLEDYFSTAQYIVRFHVHVPGCITLGIQVPSQKVIGGAVM